MVDKAALPLDIERLSIHGEEQTQQTPAEDSDEDTSAPQKLKTEVPSHLKRSLFNGEPQTTREVEHKLSQSLNLERVGSSGGGLLVAPENEISTNPDSLTEEHTSSIYKGNANGEYKDDDANAVENDTISREDYEINSIRKDRTDINEQLGQSLESDTNREEISKNEADNARDNKKLSSEEDSYDNYDDDDDDDDDFGAFSDASFDDFESASPTVTQVLPAASPDPNQTPNNSYIKLSGDKFFKADQLKGAISNLTSNIYKGDNTEDRAVRQVDPDGAAENNHSEINSAADLLSPRSEALWNELKSIPRLAPPEWKKSSIRRHFLISIGVPIDLDEVLPTSSPPVDTKVLSPSSTGFIGLKSPHFVFVSSEKHNGSSPKKSNLVSAEPETRISELASNTTISSDRVSKNALDGDLKKVKTLNAPEELVTEGKSAEAKKESSSIVPDRPTTHILTKDGENLSENQKKEKEGTAPKVLDRLNGVEDSKQSQASEENTDTVSVAEKVEPALEASTKPIQISSKNDGKIENEESKAKEDIIYIRSNEDLGIDKEQYDTIISGTNQKLTLIEDNLQSLAYYENLFNDGRHKELAKVLQRLQQYDDEMEKTLSVWNSELENLNKDHETFEAVVENVVGYTQKVRRQESFKNEKELQKRLKRQSAATKKTGYFWTK